VEYMKIKISFHLSVVRNFWSVAVLIFPKSLILQKATIRRFIVNIFWEFLTCIILLLFSPKWIKKIENLGQISEKYYCLRCLQQPSSTATYVKLLKRRYWKLPIVSYWWYNCIVHNQREDLHSCP
jgi:hypothetical protein